MEIIDLCLNLGIGFCLTLIALPNYKKTSPQKSTLILTTQATLRQKQSHILP